MDSDEILRKAWEAVEKSGVPEALHETAFKEAVAILKEEGEGTPQSPKERGNGRTSTRPAKQNRSTTLAAPSVEVDEATFFSTLADESGVAENDLRDVLTLTRDGRVHVTPPTRKLGASTSEQARTVIALVAGARGVGLGERPVRASEVHDEAKRKHCFDTSNFAAAHLGPMKGFNAGADRSEIVLTSKWIEDFEPAVNRALGRAEEEES
jgi:hypothetical protein